ncbi:hypothetical protein J2853_001937 [Streptosporangium lutulentum]|uniref:Uncharacterized protein n=1 Tax=Streptosporangium lutulentum TaxID=1461250 RepID=A0ABT9Q7K5_9ACTN|nr:hypothetical protein [Streptosporangium lutulentum]
MRFVAVRTHWVRCAVTRWLNDGQRARRDSGPATRLPSDRLERGPPACAGRRVRALTRRTGAAGPNLPAAR